ncbi:MAG TPA: nicotinamide riboside transporter PnuC [Opitutaceae bacterium]|nr:nicotinamide riboside transporter PnuC [Opitutaceae bacterium]
MTPLEIIATVLGVAGVWLMIRRSLWAFPVGIVQVVIFGWVCFGAQLYSETVLQGLFLGALVHGWWHWTHPDRGQSERPIGRLADAARVTWGVGTIALWLAWGTAMDRWTDAAVPYADAFVFAVSAASQWLQARKLIENWPGWVAANTTAIVVFATRGLYLFAGLYLVFWGMAWWGWRAWARAMAEGRRAA